jgi:hypothetical protein
MLTCTVDRGTVSSACHSSRHSSCMIQICV